MLIRHRFAMPPSPARGEGNGRSKRGDFLQSRTFAVLLDATIEARAPPGMAGAAVAAYAHPREQRVLVAVDAELDEGLRLARSVALAPEALASARPIVHDPARKRLFQRLRV